MRAASPRQRQRSRPLPVLPRFPPGRPGSKVLCLLMSMDFCAKRNHPDLGLQAGGVEGLPLEFSLTFSCLTKDCPRLGFLPRGSCRWMARTSLFKVSRMAPLLFSPLSLQTDLLGETWGGRFLESGVGEVMGLPLYPERGLWRCRRTWLEDWLGAGFLHLGRTDIWAGSFFFEGSPPVHCGMLSGIPSLYPLDAPPSIPPTPVVTIQNVPRYCQMSPVETQWLRGGATNECPSPLSLYLRRLCPESASRSETVHWHPAHISP